jgi:hypothetical protein
VIAVTSPRRDFALSKPRGGLPSPLAIGGEPQKEQEPRYGSTVKMREASMKILVARERSLLEAILALIGRSPITAAKPVVGLPAGFTEVDAAVLDWIAAEGRHISASYVRH